MITSDKKFTICTAAGDVNLVEIFEQRGAVCLIIGEWRMDLEPGAALELADTLIQVASEMQMHCEEW